MKPPARLHLFILGFWTLLGLLESSKAYVSERVRGLPPGMAHGWDAALIGNMPWWLFWAALTPVVFRLAARFRLDQPRWGRAVALHLVAGTLVSLVHLVITAVLYYYTITHGRIPSAFIQVRNIVDAYLVVDIMTYCAVVGAWYMLDFARRTREREVTALRLEARAASLESQMTEARLDALRMELNPHFLFNALNAVAGLVRRGDTPAAVTMLARLGDLLRLTLERQLSHEVPLARELELLDLYLEIERARFPDRLTVAIDVPPHVRAALVPTFILQPIVENAIRHGIAPFSAPGTVRIRASRDGDQLTLEVADTGPGFRQTRPGSGVGLANTRARLGQLYNGTASLATGNAGDSGAVVTARLPWRSEPALAGVPHG